MLESDKEYLAWVGQRIRTKRKEKKLSLDKLAALCDIEKANLSRMETGKINFTVLTFKKVSDVLFDHVSDAWKE